MLDRLTEAPSKSIRQLAQELHVSKNSEWKILKEHLLHPYNRLRVQAMGLTDYELRVQFCQWMIQRRYTVPHFEQFALFTDEACLTGDGVVNCCNSHVWNDVNPCFALVATHQKRFSINMGAGIVQDQLLETYLLPPHLNGQCHLRFIQDLLPRLLETVALVVRERMWLQLDRAPSHFDVEVRYYFDQTFHIPLDWKESPVP